MNDDSTLDFLIDNMTGVVLGSFVARKIIAAGRNGLDVTITAVEAQQFALFQEGLVKAINEAKDLIEDELL